MAQAVHCSQCRDHPLSQPKHDASSALHSVSPAPSDRSDDRWNRRFVRKQNLRCHSPPTHDLDVIVLVHKYHVACTRAKRENNCQHVTHSRKGKTPACPSLSCLSSVPHVITTSGRSLHGSLILFLLFSFPPPLSFLSFPLWLPHVFCCQGHLSSAARS